MLQNGHLSSAPLETKLCGNKNYIVTHIEHKEYKMVIKDIQLHVFYWVAFISFALKNCTKNVFIILHKLDLQRSAS